MSYSANPDFAEARLQIPALASGSLTYAGDSYTWNNHETLARTNWAYSGVLNSSWSVTYTFPNTIPAGQIILGVQGLGRRDPLPGENAQDCITTATVLQNGTHLGDWTGSMNVGPTLFTPGSGMFSMMNSLSGPGGQDPWWNTGLALVRIDDPLNSLTVRFAQTSGDGVGVNIGTTVPEPGTLALLGLGGLGLLRRR
ncbi:MAG: PEP-CTERM sorting domain-containing protein [Planctomycetes bacterium]|nr:PEP-CTERM sorting domain-containing protein [Planctomycetota bacterium]